MAEYDIGNIETYIKYKLRNSIAANNTIRGLIRKIHYLKRVPYMGRIYNQEFYFNRVISYKNFLIFYEINEIEKVVWVERIIHSKQSRKML